MNDDPRRAIGGNKPPLNEAAQLESEEALEEFGPRKEEFLEALAKIDIKNRGDAQLATDRVGLAGAFVKIVLAKRDGMVEPYRDAAGAVRSTFGNFTEDLVEAINVGLAKIAKYRDDVADLAKKQQEEQAALIKPVTWPAHPNVGHEETSTTAHLAMRSPAAKPKPAPLRGDLGKKVVARETKRAVLVDMSLVPDFIMQSQQVKTAIEAVATSMLKQFPNPAGFKITTSEKVNVQ